MPAGGDGDGGDGPASGAPVSGRHPSPCPSGRRKPPVAAKVAAAFPRPLSRRPRPLTGVTTADIRRRADIRCPPPASHTSQNKTNVTQGQDRASAGRLRRRAQHGTPVSRGPPHRTALSPTHGALPAGPPSLGFSVRQTRLIRGDEQSHETKRNVCQLS